MRKNSGFIYQRGRYGPSELTGRSLVIIINPFFIDNYKEKKNEVFS